MPDDSFGIGAVRCNPFVGVNGIAVHRCSRISNCSIGLKKNSRISHITEELHKTSKFLENALTRRIQSRMLKAFPGIEPAVGHKHEKVKTKVFAEGCSFYKLVSLFFIGAFLGDIVETIFCLITSGVLMSRSSVVYGSFSMVWGLSFGITVSLPLIWADESICCTAFSGELRLLCG